MCYCWTTTDGISATVCCDKEYPEKAAFIMLNKLMVEFRELTTNNPYNQGLDTVTKDQTIKFPALERYL